MTVTGGASAILHARLWRGYDESLFATSVYPTNGVGGFRRTENMVKAAVRSSAEQDTATAQNFAPVYLEESARDHVWIHSLPWAELAEKDGFRVFDRGEGSTIYDIHGRGYFDAISGLWVVNAGHGRADIAAKMGEQAARLAYASAMSLPRSRRCSWRI
jgi:4-aminobutyrate aminotransferase-like enzyme